jgi:hypothetical protein
VAHGADEDHAVKSPDSKPSAKRGAAQKQGLPPADASLAALEVSAKAPPRDSRRVGASATSE